ncbi:MAG TPA: amino acid adenylation domain-containing protein, partial [Thermoanaerobaculia bacterium]
VQAIRPAAPFALDVVDLSGLPESAREATALARIGEEAGRPFDLARGPLVRGALLRLAAEDSIVVLTLHHIVSDGWSMGILVREMTALYAAFSAGTPSPLPDLPVQYADFAAWQRSWLHGEVLEGEISFWRRQLAGLPPLLELPTDRPRSAARSSRGTARLVRLPAGLARQVQALGRSEGATLFMVLLAGFQALLARFSGQRDLAVGSPVAGRNRVEIEGLIGFFVNTLVLRGDLSGEPTFRELLGRVRETALAAQTHQNVPFERLVQELTPERSLAHTPLFQVMFVLQNAPVESLEIPGLRLRPVDGVGTTATFDLTLSLEEYAGGIGGTVEHATDLFDATTIDRLIRHFETLLTAALAAPELPVSDLPLLSPAEEGQILREWNDTRTEGLAEGCLHGDVAAQAERAPDAVAVEQGAERWTYRRLLGSARRHARHLQELGVGPDVVVGLCAERSPSLIVGLLAVLEAGGAWLPLDPDLPPERLAFLLDDSGARILLVQEPLLARVPAGDRQAILLDARWDAGEDMGEPLGVEVSPDHLACVIYTSGSTGRPKGVMVPHRGLCNRLRGARRVDRIDQRDAVLQKASPGFDASVWEIFTPLTAGGRLVLAEPGRQVDGPALVRTIREHRVTIVDFVPSLLAVFLDEEDVATCVSLRQVFASGEALTPELRDRALSRLPAPLANLYGPTETSIDTTRHICAPGQDPHRVPIGRPIANTRLHVADRQLRPAPAGVPGELLVGGAGVARGYLGRPDLTAERFVPDPFGCDPGARLYRTGDLARWLPDGSLDFLGRIDHQVKIRGVRIEPGEIEVVLSALPGVREAAVMAREGRLVAWVVGDVAPDDLRRSLRERLPETMVPSAFVKLGALPLTSSGKVDRKALPAPEQQSTGEGHRAPRTPVEEILAGIWAGLLGVERVGIDDNFFDLGGHSLLATRVISHLRSAFGVETPLRELFEAPVLADLAARIEAARRTRSGPPAPPLVPIPRKGPLPLSFAQQRLWFLDRLAPGNLFYTMYHPLRLSGALDVEALQRAFQEVVRRQESLRTAFPETSGRPCQVIDPEPDFRLPRVDLAALPEASGRAELIRLSRDEVQRPFDLARGPLFRATLIRQEAREHTLLVNLHHVISDGWSMGILFAEIAALYGAFCQGAPSPLPELPIQYADFALWQRELLQGERLDAELEYWRGQLAGIPEILDLPADHPRPAVDSFRGAQRPFTLPTSSVRALTGLTRRHGATRSMTMLAGFQALLGRYARQDHVAVGMAIANRTRHEVEGLVGFFVNTLVLHGDLAGSPGFGCLLDRVRETALAAYTHQDLPFERLVEELQPERVSNRNPLIQVMFGYQNFPRTREEVQGLVLSIPEESAIGTGTAKFDLTLFVLEEGDRLQGALEYNSEIFEVATIQRLLTHYESLLSAAAAEPEVPIERLPLLTPAERHHLVREHNDTASAWPATASLQELFAVQARQTPDAAAAVFGDATLSYGELDRRARRLADHLRRLGIGPESRVGLCVERSLELVVGLLGIVQAGGAYVPLDPD